MLVGIEVSKVTCVFNLILNLARFDDYLANLEINILVIPSLYSANPSEPYVLNIGDIPKLSQVYRGPIIAIEILSVNKLVFSACFSVFLV